MRLFITSFSGGDSIIPVITIIGEDKTIAQTSTYTDLGATAEDNIDGDITGSITTVSNVNSAVLGNYTVTYNVQDSSGNSAIQQIRNVEVIAEGVNAFPFIFPLTLG